jgi:hypothetical protein
MVDIGQMVGLFRAPFGTLREIAAPTQPGRAVRARGRPQLFDRRPCAQPANSACQALEAAEAGVAEVVRLLQAPEDLERLPQLVLDAQGRARANQAALGAALGAQVRGRTASARRFAAPGWRRLVRAADLHTRPHHLHACQVDAARYGLELLDRSHRHIARLRSAIDDIGALCAEAGAFVEDSGPVRALSLAHLNVTGAAFAGRPSHGSGWPTRRGGGVKVCPDCLSILPPSRAR